jgi:hypothetical protein
MVENSDEERLSEDANNGVTVATPTPSNDIRLRNMRGNQARLKNQITTSCL